MTKILNDFWVRQLYLKGIFGENTLDMKLMSYLDYCNLSFPLYLIKRNGKLFKQIEIMKELKFYCNLNDHYVALSEREYLEYKKSEIYKISDVNLEEITNVIKLKDSLRQNIHIDNMDNISVLINNYRIMDVQYNS